MGTGRRNVPRVCGFIGWIPRAWPGGQVEGLVTLRCWSSCGWVGDTEGPDAFCESPDGRCKRLVKYRFL